MEKKSNRNLEIELDEIDKAIIDFLKKSEGFLTTYKIAKEVKIAWSTANTHCYKLEAEDILERKRTPSKYGEKKIVWRLKIKGPTLEKFMK